MKATVTTNYPVIVAKLGKLPTAARSAVHKALAVGMREVAGTAQRLFMSGPRPTRLGVVSGQLRRSVTQRVRQDSRDITGTVGANTPYAARHEFGFRGSEKVRAHNRVKSLTVAGKKVNIGRLRGAQRERRWVARTGKWVKDKHAPIVGYKRSAATVVAAMAGKGVSAAFARVKAHTRRVSYRGRPYLRPALLRTLTRLRDLVLGAIQQSAKKT